MTKTEIYDEIFELLAAAEMQLRNANYWQVYNKLQIAANRVAEIAKLSEI